ncbi:MAG: 2-(1,2-epoxy-1,2-dihydrophenyl)acetyl-CoA isomerase [Cryomorphaceae bacterium]|nr:MAG: 2-(1,2-epoxy-1,2-dihydrophenyl)acetyl-CoA isomerase [Cryomorphaceae bacterium]
MSHIEINIEDQVCIIKLNRPKVFNSFNKEMAFELQEILDNCEKNPAVRSILLTAEGKAFCAGQDLQELTAPDGPKLSDIVREHYNPIIKRIRSIEKPIVCAVNGVAAGAGANIALACDITIAGESVAFIQAFSKIGLIPDSGGTFFLPRSIGMQKATALMMLADKVMAADAEKMGMIYKVCPDESLMGETLKVAKKLAKLPTIGLGLTKRALNKSITNDLTAQLALEDELQTAAGKTYDYNEGVAAFLEKRKPKFKGE